MSYVVHKMVGNRLVTHPTMPNIEGQIAKCNLESFWVLCDPPVCARQWKDVTCKHCLKRKK